MKRYNEFLGTSPASLFPDYHNLLASRGQFMNILNVKYILTQQQVNHPSFVLADSCYNGKVKIYKNQTVLPRAWVVGRYESIRQETASLTG